MQRQRCIPGGGAAPAMERKISIPVNLEPEVLNRRNKLEIKVGGLKVEWKRQDLPRSKPDGPNPIDPVRQSQRLPLLHGMQRVAWTNGHDRLRGTLGMPKRWLCWIGIAVCSLGILQLARAEDRQRSFASADEATNALVTALREHSEADWLAILGPEADHLIKLKGPDADQRQIQDFLALYDEKHAIARKERGCAELNVGPDDWPLPIPIIETRGRWTFDTSAGAQSIIDRHIGRNELSAIRTLLACVDAQHDYFELSEVATGSAVYATRLVSTPGRHDGLYWPPMEDGTASPLGRLIDGVQEAGFPGELGPVLN
jgi:Protein of unknown function (DUF2950)